jgi:Holliday junction resolvase RusA-like endonuclease
MTPDAEGFTFVVLGRAAPQGSKVLDKGKDGKPFMRESSGGVHPWRKKIIKAAMGSDGRPMATFKGPVEIHIEFEFRRAKSNTDDFPTVRTIGDGDKLTRAVWDALTQAGVIEDDAYCVDWSGSKRYAEEDRTYITVRSPRGYSPDAFPGPPAHGFIVDFAQQIGVTIPEGMTYTELSPSCCNTVDHKGCKLFGDGSFAGATCPCPDHCV